MAVPKNETQLFGMFLHLWPFIANPSTHAAALLELLTIGHEFTWNSTFDATFCKLKSLVCEDITLRYFNTMHPVVIQIHVSKVSLGAALPMDNNQ